MDTKKGVIALNWWGIFFVTTVIISALAMPFVFSFDDKDEDDLVAKLVRSSRAIR